MILSAYKTASLFILLLIHILSQMPLTLLQAFLIHAFISTLKAKGHYTSLSCSVLNCYIFDLFSYMLDFPHILFLSHSESSLSSMLMPNIP